MCVLAGVLYEIGLILSSLQTEGDLRAFAHVSANSSLILPWAPMVCSPYRQLRRSLIVAYFPQPSHLQGSDLGWMPYLMHAMSYHSLWSSHVSLIWLGVADSHVPDFPLC